jgi:hypothetical protein
MSVKHKDTITCIHFTLRLVTLLINNHFDFFVEVPLVRNWIQSLEFRSFGTGVTPCGIPMT